MNRHTLSVLVENKPGVLVRIAGLFSRRGFNIESLAVGFGCHAVTVDGTEQLAKEFNAALGADGPTVIVVPTKPQVAHLG